MQLSKYNQLIEKKKLLLQEIKKNKADLKLLNKQIKRNGRKVWL